MRKLMTLVLISAFGFAATGCMLTSKTDLKAVADAAKLKSVTTGDGNFDNYKAVSYNESHDFGIALGFGLIKLMEIFPMRSNEDQLIDIANEAKAAGADAMINVDPHKEWFFGFPFIFIGVYMDTASGTGIKTGK